MVVSLVANFERIINFPYKVSNGVFDWNRRWRCYLSFRCYSKFWVVFLIFRVIEINALYSIVTQQPVLINFIVMLFKW